MSRICPLFSGSSGNSTYIGTKNGGILVDAGASMKGICSAVESAGGSLSEIIGIVVTHEHCDHIKGLKTFLTNTNVECVASTETLQSLISSGQIPTGTKTVALDEGAFEINGIEIKRFPTSHDCKGSSGYRFVLPDNQSVAVCTDLGVVTDKVRNAVIGCDTILLESNHDIEMLKKGLYPPQLKMRIMSETGHLSNNACSAELANLLKNGAKRFILGHLSRENNLPLLAKSCAEAALMDIGAKNGKDYILTVAAPSGNGVTVF